MTENDTGAGRRDRGMGREVLHHKITNVIRVACRKVNDEVFDAPKEEQLQYLRKRAQLIAELRDALTSA